MTLLLQKLLEELHWWELFMALALLITIRSLHQRNSLGLPSWPLVGMLPSLLIALRGANDFYEWITDVLRRTGGTFTFHGPTLSNFRSVITADPRNLEYILKTRFSNFPKGPCFCDAVSDLLGEGIFSANGEIWRLQRRVASIRLHSSRFRAKTAESMVELVHQKLLPVLDGVCENGAMVDLQDVLLRFAFDNVCMLSFGVDPGPGCLRPGLPEVLFAKAFEDATSAIVYRFVIPTTIWKALRFLRVGPERVLRSCIEQLNEVAYGIIRKREQELADGDSSTDWKTKNDLLTMFIKGRKEDGHHYEEEFLRDVCLNFILAGRDTSSVALAWFFWLLGRHPEVEKKVLQELCGILAQKNQELHGKNLSSEFTDQVVFGTEEVKKMEYLHAALSEALRLYPPIPVNHREVIEDDVLPDGTVLKKGTQVMYAIYAMGRMESIWGNDCREFRPERWILDGRFVTESPYRFPAFNGGPRLCIGKEFAYYQMKFVAAAVLLRYHIHLIVEHPVTPKFGGSMYMKNGLKVTLRRRDARDLARYM